MAATTARAPLRWRVFLPIALLLVFAVLTEQVVTSGPVTVLDRRIDDAVRVLEVSASWHWLNSPARAVTMLGGPHVAMPVLFLAAGWAAVRRRSVGPAILAVLAVGILVSTVLTLKTVITRPGPNDLVPLHNELGFFPSGHTATAVVCYGGAAGLFALGSSDRWRRWLVGIAVAVNLAVGFSLVWCRFHWFTDVIASWALGGLVLWMVWLLRPLVWHRALTLGSDRKSAAPEPVSEVNRRGT